MVEAAANSSGNILDPYSGGFQDLMPHRVEHLLLVSSLYESFILEEEGLLTELITSAYVDMQLTDHDPLPGDDGARVRSGGQAAPARVARGGAG